MGLRYVAYGLQLDATFELSGMYEGEDKGLPSLTLELAGAQELAEVWGPPDPSPYWCGLLGDGRTLTIDRGSGAARLFNYGDRALFSLDASGETLRCAPISEGLDWQRVLLGKVLSSISVMRGYEALHASAVDAPSGAVAIAAPSGVGKTTLSLELARRGWPLLSDDVVALTHKTHAVLAHPGTPHVNLSAAAWTRQTAGRLGSVLGELDGELWVALSARCRERRPIHAICLLERAPELSLAAEILPANPLPLAPYVMGLPGETGRVRSRFALYADLMTNAKLVHLTASLEDPPGALADVLQQELAEHALQGAWETAR